MVSGHVSTKPEDRQSILIVWFVFDFPTFLNLKKKKLGCFYFGFSVKCLRVYCQLLTPHLTSHSCI